MRYHYIQDVLEIKEFHIEKIHIDDSGSNMMMKAPLMIKLLSVKELQV